LSRRDEINPLVVAQRLAVQGVDAARQVHPTQLPHRPVVARQVQEELAGLVVIAVREPRDVEGEEVHFPFRGGHAIAAAVGKGAELPDRLALGGEHAAGGVDIPPLGPRRDVPDQADA
jgi:hypothetical protein